MADDSTAIELSRSELREVAGYTVTCARPASLATTADRPTCGPDRRQSWRYVGGTELVLWESQIGTTSMRDSRGSYAVVRIWECPVEHRRSGVCEHWFPGLNGPLSPAPCASDTPTSS